MKALMARPGFDSPVDTNDNQPNKAMDTTIEYLAAQTILENSLGTITIGKKSYEIPNPTTGTLIMVSALISDLPEIDPDTPKEQFISTLIKAAGECNALGQIAATIVLGAKRIKEHPATTIETTEYKRRWSWRRLKFIERPEITITAVFERDYLAEQILDSMNPAELHEFIDHALSEAHLADFFVLTTSLRTKSILTPTREVGETTASGDSSEAGLNIGN